MVVSAVTASSRQELGGWADVVEANSERVGADPEAVWVEALGDAGKLDAGGVEWSSRCPNPLHNGDGDTKASLRWRVAPDGTVLVHCHGGCEYREILDAVGLEAVQLRVAVTRYVYRAGADRELAGVKQRTEGVSGKTMTWPERHGTPGLWLAPDLLEWAAASVAAGRTPVLWLCEGEADATLVAGALRAGWVPEGDDCEAQDAERLAATTTTPDGAGGIGDQAQADLQALVALAPGIVWRIATDPDPAGEKRAAELQAKLLTWGALRVEVWRWDGLDAGDAVRKLGQRWWRESIVDEPADPYKVSSDASGELREGPFPDGSGYGLLWDRPTAKGGVQTRVVMSIAPRVVGVEPGERGTAAWHLEWPDDDGVVRTDRIVSREAVSRREFVNRGHPDLLLGGQISIEQFAKWLGHHGKRAPVIRTSEVCGWDDDGQEFAAYEGPLVGASKAIGGRGDPMWAYGTEADEAEAAELVTRILALRPLDESVPVLAALAANAARPWADQYAGSVRLLQVPALSGAGKTSFLRLAVRLFGSVGEGSGDESAASLSRTLTAGTGPVWLDDVRADQVNMVADQLRGAATGGSRKRAVKEDLGSVVGQRARAFVVYSAESELGAGDKAMTDRSMTVRFEADVQGRTWKDGEEQFVWMKRMGSMSGDRHAPMTRAAGTLVRALARIAPEVADRMGEPGGGDRHRRMARWTVFGAELLADWLTEQGHGQWAEVVRTEAREWAHADAEARDRAHQEHQDVYLITEMLPRAILAGENGVGGWKELGRDAVDPREGLRQATRVGGSHQVMPVAGVVAWSYPAVGEDGEERPVYVVAVNLERLWGWASSDAGRRAGVGQGTAERHLTKEAIQAQLGVAHTGRIKRTQFGGRGGPQLAWWILSDVLHPDGSRGD